MTGAYFVVDVDDTLVDTCSTGWRKCVETARLLGLSEPSRDSFRKLYGAVPFEECVPQLHPTVDLDEYRTAYDGLASWLPPTPIGDVRAALDHAARAGFRLGVLTNGDGRKTEIKLRAAGCRESDFEFVCHRDNSTVPKPQIAAFHRLVTEFSVDPARSWYVSDQGADWAAAAAAGFGTVGVVAGHVAPRPAGEVPALLVPRLDAATECLRPLASAGPMRTPPRQIGFDAGFTLIDHVALPVELIRDELAGRGVPVAVEAISAAFGAVCPPAGAWTSDAKISRLLVGFYRDVLDRLPGAEHRAEVTTAVIAKYTRPDNWRARPGAIAAVTRARAAGLRTGVLSNWQSSLPAVLGACGIAELLDCVRSSAGLGAAKPDPAAFAAFGAALGVDDPAGLVFVGDDPAADAGGALSSGHRAAVIDGSWDSPAVRAMLEVITS